MKIGLCFDDNSVAFNDMLLGMFTFEEIKRQKPDCKVFSTTGRKTEDLMDSDALILGGGSLLGELAIPPFSKIPEWGGGYNGKIYVLGTGYRYYPNYELLQKGYERSMKELFDRAERICLRGKKSLELCEFNNLNTSRVELLADAVFLADATNLNKDNVIGFNVRETYEDQKVAFGKLIPKLSEAFDFLAQQENKPVTFLAAHHEDYNSAERVIANMRPYASNIKSGNYLEYYEELSKLSFFCGMRCHTQLMTGINNAPFIPLEYHFEKMWDALSPLNLEDYVLNIEDLNVENIAKLYEKRFEFIKRFAEGAKKKKKELQQFITKILND